MMTLDDIMIGDQVLLNSEPTEVTPAILELMNELNCQGLLDNNLKPICLSTKFFEANGFIRETKNKWRIPKLPENFSLFQWGNGSWSIEDHVLIEVRSVHELQHLFRMVGLRTKFIV